MISPPLIRQEVRADTIEDFEEVARAYGWGSEISQTAPGNLPVACDFLTCGGMTAVKLQLGAASTRHMQAPTSGLTVGVNFPANGSNLWCHHNYQGPVFFKAPTQDFDAVNSGAMTGYQIHVDDELLEKLCVSHELSSLPLASDALLAPVSTRHFHNVQSGLRHFWSGQHGSVVLDSGEMLFATLLQGISAPTGSRRTVSASLRTRAYRQAREMMHAQAAERISMIDLCNHVGCSRRTLTLAFAENLGISPMQYLKILRLNLARKNLLRNEGESVTDIANFNGFWHMGQFARDYRSCFGELPSESRSRRHRD